MYTIGFIKTERPDVLINPDTCRSILKPGKSVRVAITGYEVDLLFGINGVIQDTTTRFIHLMPRQIGHYPVSRIDNMPIPD